MPSKHKLHHMDNFTCYPLIQIVTFACKIYFSQVDRHDIKLYLSCMGAC